jgi:Tol biopolymer transport system component
MKSTRAIAMCGVVSALSVLTLACRDAAPTAPMHGSSPALASAVNLTGRIAYTAGTIHVYNLATNTDVDLRVSGVNPKFSPDGTLITCQCSGIKVMNADGTGQRVLTSTGGVPSFDPTGTKIVFDNNGIWKINVDGTGLTRLTAVNGHWPSWSSDGTQIVYGAPVGKLGQLFIMNADGTNQHQALTSGSVIDVVWQPSPKILFGVLNGNYDLYSYDPANSSSLTRLTTSTGTDDEPSWSPDGTQISWTGGSKRTAGIWIMNADGTGKQGPVISGARQGSWGR